MKQAISTRSETSASVAAGANALPDIGLVAHAGWLTKAGQGVFAKAQQRWCVLYHTAEVHYFDREWATSEALAEALAAGAHKGVISLAGVTPSDVCRTKPNSATDLGFYIATPMRKWQLTAPSLDAYERWRDAILSACQAAE